MAKQLKCMPHVQEI